MSILNQNLLSLDFWQDKVTYAGHALPTGSVGCAAMNITDEQIRSLVQLAIPLVEMMAVSKKKLSEIAEDIRNTYGRTLFRRKGKRIADYADDAYHLSIFAVRLSRRRA